MGGATVPCRPPKPSGTNDPRDDPLINVPSYSHIATFVLPETLAATNLAGDVASLQQQGVSVFTYPLAVRLLSPARIVIGAFVLTLTGPLGLYTVLGSADLNTGHEVGVATNHLGSTLFTDATTVLSPGRFYRALPRNPPANMVFIPLNTLLMGSPACRSASRLFANQFHIDTDLGFRVVLVIGPR